MGFLKILTGCYIDRNAVGWKKKKNKNDNSIVTFSGNTRREEACARRLCADISPLLNTKVGGMNKK